MLQLGKARKEEKKVGVMIMQTVERACFQLSEMFLESELTNGLASGGIHTNSVIVLLSLNGYQYCCHCLCLAVNIDHLILQK